MYHLAFSIDMNRLILICKVGYSFSKYAKFSEKLEMLAFDTRDLGISESEIREYQGVKIFW